MGHTSESLAKEKRELVNLPYAFADGSLDIAYEEIAQAKANCTTANLEGRISDEIWQKALRYFKSDYNRLGHIPKNELEQLIEWYTTQNRAGVYLIEGVQIVCE